jgi:hypothetical protein
MRMVASIRPIRGERGSALLLALLISIAVSSLALTAVIMAGNSQLINAYESRQGELEAAADAGIELGRAMLNVNPARYPLTGYATLADHTPVVDAAGRTVPDLWRSIYAGPVGNTTGQYGNFGNLLVITGDRSPDRVIRRTDITEESFAKYAYFTDVEGGIRFANGDYLTGPVHSNDVITIDATHATFQGPLSTHMTITNRTNGTYLAGYTEGAGIIPMPTTRNLTSLQTLASTGGASFVGSTTGTAGQAKTRIEFVALDLDGDGAVTGEDEGFFKVYMLNAASDNQTNREWLTADLPVADPANFDEITNLNCGYWNGVNFIRVDTMNGGTVAAARTRRRAALLNARRACFLGGSNALNNGNVFVVNDGRGSWQRYSTTPDARVVARVGATEAQYLYPISHNLNPNFKGVIYASNKVAVSGMLRGQVTIAASDNIVLVDDLVYATDPGAGSCADMLGLFSGADVVIADNMIATPQDPDGDGVQDVTYEELPADERINGVILALSSFTAENYNVGPTSGQNCDAVVRGRGCLRLTGGIIQESRGPVATAGGGFGYVKRYGYDACAAQYPPPYFPTTGKFRKVGVFDVDPTGFTLTQIFH